MVRRPLLDFVERDEGADVLVITNMWPTPDRPVWGIFVKRQVDSLRSLGVRCDVLYLRGYVSALAYPIAAMRLAWSSLAWRGRYRVVHVHAGETALAARFHVGTPMLVSYSGDDVLGDRLSSGEITRRARLRARLIREHARLFAVTIAKSRRVREALPAPARRRSALIPNGVNMAVFRPLDQQVARRALGWSVGERVALFAATKPHSPAKRLWLARAACQRARESLPAARLHVAGNEDPARMPVLMGAADCLLVTSAVEGSPNVVKEALMCNLPVITTPVGDVEERLEGVSPSWLCSPTVETLGQALVECLREPRRSNGRLTAAGIAADNVARQVLALYNSLAGDPWGAPG